MRPGRRLSRLSRRLRLPSRAPRITKRPTHTPRRFKIRARRSPPRLKRHWQRCTNLKWPGKSNRSMARAIRFHRICLPALLPLLIASLLGCVEKIPEDLVQSIESLDRRLIEVHGATYAPDAYYRFVKHWVAVKARLDAEEDEINWPWEENRLVAE